VQGVVQPVEAADFALSKAEQTPITIDEKEHDSTGSPAIGAGGLSIIVQVHLPAYHKDKRLW
jgi:hypothetical protein